MSKSFCEAVKELPTELRIQLLSVPDETKKATWEVRLAAGAPIMLFGVNGIGFVGSSGRVGSFSDPASRLVTRACIDEAVQRLCSYSLHSHEDDIKNGFLTLNGGHRAGLCGTAVCENGKVSGLRCISSINLRIARENKSAAKELCNALYNYSLPSVIIAGAPSSGKTTVLRDLARRLSGGFCRRARKVAVIDERGEIAAMRAGMPSFDMGLCCDVFSGYPKAQAIETAVRAMSPEIIICDELSGIRELEAVRQGFNSGVSFAVSIHASDKKDMIARPVARELLESGEFGYVVFLKNDGEPCRIEKIYGTDELLNEICGGSSCHCGICRNRVLHKGTDGTEGKTA